MSTTPVSRHSSFFRPWACALDDTLCGNGCIGRIFQSSMPCTARAVRACLKDKYRQPARDCPLLWLSEQYLQDVFTRFCRQQRRYGSNVPGPLEARRRSSKRKATSVSHIPDSSASINPAILFNSKVQSGWWSENRRENNHEIAQSQALPTYWPFGLFGPSSTNPGAPAAEVSTRDPIHFDRTARLVAALQSEKCCASLRRALESEGLHLSQSQELASLVLRHIVANDWSDKELRDFFLAPDLNPPGTSNHLELLKLGTEFDAERHATIIQTTFPKAMELGIVSITDMQAIVLAYPDCTGPSTTGNSVTAFWLDCLTAVKQSNVVSIGDLNTTDFMERWISKIHEHDMCSTTADLIWHLRRFHSMSEDALLLDIVGRWLSSPKAKNLQCLYDVFRFIDKVARPKVLFMVTESLLMQAMKNPALKPDPEQTVCTVLKARLCHFHVSKSGKNLQTNPTRDSSGELQRTPLPLESWAAILSLFKDRAWLRKAIKNKLLVSSLSTISQHNPFDLSMQQRLVAVAWTVRRICNAKTSASCLDSSDFLKTLTDYFGVSKEGVPDDAIKNILATLDDLPFPAKPSQGQMFILLLKPRSKPGVGFGAITSAKDPRFHSLVNDRLYQASIAAYPHSLVELVELVNQDMAQFEAFARASLQERKSATLIIKRILRHNHRLHRSLSAGWNDHDRWNDPENILLSNDVSTTDTHLGGYKNSEIVDMVNRLALTVAQSNIHSPLQALARVKWYYYFLHRHGAPIRPQMVQALWHAGVYRTRGAVSSTFKEWVGSLKNAAAQRYQRQIKNLEARPPDVKA